MKCASTSKKLDSNVFIETAVFLACPHLTEITTGEILYPLNPKKFGRIGNFYSERDAVVKNIANKFATPSGFKMEVPESSFIDTDLNCDTLYENFNMQAPSELSGREVHGWMHSEEMANAIGNWIATGGL